MPTYEYACVECGNHIEVVQSMSDPPLAVCAACGGRLRKVFSPIGIVFKGSGFYRTDSRGKPTTAKDGAKETAAAKSDSSKTSSDSSGSTSKSASSSSTKPASKSA
ncbi:MAG TPA: FmdB family zinc ribbon protein [Actinomycetes bacterium]|nr:FmdB family zinc ribbon protein [Actinomycetes bacterium]